LQQLSASTLELTALSLQLCLFLLSPLLKCLPLLFGAGALLISSRSCTLGLFALAF
jgi:hypothetical protein